jgi:hypothetical protein
MSNLTELVLTGNPITDTNVSSNAFADLTSVTMLDLQACLLTTIPRSVQQMRALHTLRMTGNSVECSCTSLGWVESWRANQGFIARVEGECANDATDTIQHYIDTDGRHC